MATPPPPAATAPTPGARVYVGKLPRDVRKEDIEGLFKGYGVWDIKLMGTFGFCEFSDSRDAEDVAKKFDGADLHGEKIVVEIAKGGARQSRDPYAADPRARQPRVRRGDYRIIISNLPPRTSWQDLKDIGREAGQISFADVDPVRPDEGILEYSNREDMEKALDKIEGLDLRGNKLRADPAPPGPPPPMSGPPPPRGGYGRGGYDDYPPPYGPPPPMRGGYGAPRGAYDYDYGYDRGGYGPPPPPRGGYDRGGYDRGYYGGGGGGGGRGGYDRGGGGYGDRRPPPPSRDDDRYSRRSTREESSAGGRGSARTGGGGGGDRGDSPPRRTDVD